MPAKKTTKKVATTKRRPVQKKKSAPASRKSKVTKKSSSSVARWVRANITAIAIVSLVVLLGSIWIFSNKDTTQDDSSLQQSGDAAMLLVGPTNTPKVGEPFTVSLYADSKDTNVNAVQATLVYPSDTLTLQSVDTASSAYPIDAHQTQSDGRVEIVRGVIGGLTENKKVSDVVFVAKKPGSFSLDYDKKGTLLLSSASNTNILAKDSFNSMKIEVTNGN